jgi:hypothetical protein
MKVGFGEDEVSGFLALTEGEMDQARKERIRGLTGAHSLSIQSIAASK